MLHRQPAPNPPAMLNGAGCVEADVGLSQIKEARTRCSKPRRISPRPARAETFPQFAPVAQGSSWEAPPTASFLPP